MAYTGLSSSAISSELVSALNFLMKIKRATNAAIARQTAPITPTIPAEERLVVPCVGLAVLALEFVEDNKVVVVSRGFVFTKEINSRELTKKLS